MSKIGIKPIEFSRAKINVGDNVVNGSVEKLSFAHQLPSDLTANVDNGLLSIGLADGVVRTRQLNMVWGLHRALLANKIAGIEKGFSYKIKIVGLGYKAALAGQTVTMSLGYSHKITFELDPEVKLEMDKSGQLLTLSSHDKFKLGSVCAYIRSLRPPEPYKGTGIFINDQEKELIRKAGKSKKS